MANDYQIQVGDTKIEASSVVNSMSIYNVLVNVIRDTKVSDRTGTSRVPVVIVNSMPCHIKWLKGKEKLLFNKKTHLLDAILKCRKPAGVVVATTDRIFYDPDYYEIVDVIDENNLGTLLEIAIRKIK